MNRSQSTPSHDYRTLLAASRLSHARKEFDLAEKTASAAVEVMKPRFSANNPTLAMAWNHLGNVRLERSIAGLQQRLTLIRLGLFDSAAECSSHARHWMDRALEAKFEAIAILELGMATAQLAELQMVVGKLCYKTENFADCARLLRGFQATLAQLPEAECKESTLGFVQLHIAKALRRQGLFEEALAELHKLKPVKLSRLSDLSEPWLALLFAQTAECLSYRQAQSPCPSTDEQLLKAMMA